MYFTCIPFQVLTVNPQESHWPSNNSLWFSANIRSPSYSKSQSNSYTRSINHWMTISVVTFFVPNSHETLSPLDDAHPAAVQKPNHSSVLCYIKRDFSFHNLLQRFLVSHYSITSSIVVSVTIKHTNWTKLATFSISARPPSAVYSYLLLPSGQQQAHRIWNLNANWPPL